MNNTTGSQFTTGESFWEESCTSSLEALAVIVFPKEVRYTVGIIALLLAVPTALLNALVLATIVHNKRLQTTSNTLLGGLAVTDFLTAVILLPSFASIYLVDNVQEHCNVVNISTIFALGTMLATFSSMTLIATDRYLAIFRPFLYRKITDRKGKLIKIVAVELILCFCVSGASLFTPKKMLFNVTATIMLAITLIWSFYVHTRSYYLSKHIRKTDRKQQRAKPREKYDEKNRRIGRMVAIMLVALCVCLFPFLGGLVLTTVYRGRTVTNYFYPSATVLLMINSLLNPLIYCWKMREIRRAIAKMFFSDVSIEASVKSHSNHGVEENSTKMSVPE